MFYRGSTAASTRDVVRAEGGGRRLSTNEVPAAVLEVPLRSWRLVEGELQTARSRCVLLRIRLDEAVTEDVAELSRQELDTQLARIDEGLRVALSLFREGHPAHSG